MELETVKEEIAIIKANNMSLNDYIRRDRKGTKERLNRKERKVIYSLSQDDNRVIELEKELQKMRDFSNMLDRLENRVSKKDIIKANIAYDSICKYRDEVLLFDT